MNNSVGTKYLAIKLVVASLVFIILGFIIDDIVTKECIYKSLALVVISTCASIFGAGAAWEVVCKKSFAKEILLLNDVSENYIESGIEFIFSNFNDINWKKELQDTKYLKVFMTYGYTWRNRNRELIEKIVKDGEVTVVLPDFTVKEIYDELDRRFKYGSYDENGKNESTSEIIKKAAKDFRSMGATVKLYSGTILSSYYAFDSHYIFAPFKHHNEKKGSVPAIKCSRGTFYEFCKIDMDTILNVSKEWSEEDGK